MRQSQSSLCSIKGDLLGPSCESHSASFVLGRSKIQALLHSSAKGARKARGCPLFSWLYLVNPCWSVSVCSGVMVQCQTWIQWDVVPVCRILCTSLNHRQAEAVSQHMQKQKDLGGGQIGIFQRNFHYFLVIFFSDLYLSVGSTPGSVISQSLQQ